MGKISKSQPHSKAARKSARGAAIHRHFHSFNDIVYPWSSPIPVIFVEGDSVEMGRQFTKATKNITKRNVTFNLPEIEKLLQKSGVKKRDYVRSIEEAVRKYTTSEYLDEIQSIADTAGVTYESVILINANVDIMATLPHPESKDRFFCSVFAAWGKATRGSSTIAGHNDDGARIMDQYSVLKIAKPKHGHPFVSPLVPGYLAYDAIVNARQVFTCGTAVDVNMKNSEAIYDGVPNWILYRWLGQYSSNTDDAVERLRSAKKMSLKNWCFISKDQGGKVVESTPKHQSLMRYPSKDKDWFGVSTCIVCPELSRYVVGSKKPTSGVYRMASVEREVAQRHGEIDPDSAAEILSSHYDSLRKRRVASEHTPCRHMEFEGRFAGTCRCMIASFYETKENQKRRTRIDISLGNPCNGYWRQLYFDEKFNLVKGYEENNFEYDLGRLLVTL